MDIQLHHLSNADKEAFVEGFAAAAAMDFPHFDAERDALRDEPWSRPWENGPLTLVVRDKTMPSAKTLGRQWFWTGCARQDHAQRQDAWQAVVLDRARGHAA